MSQAKALEAAAASLEQTASDTVITLAEIDRAKRAIVVLMDVFKAAGGFDKSPIEVRQDIEVLMRLIRKIEAL